MGLIHLIHRFQTTLFCMVFALLSACNPVPLSVVASDFSINGVTGTSTNTTTASTTAASTTTASTATSKTTGSAANTVAATTSNTNTVQNVTIDLTNTEACTTFTSLVAEVQLDEGVKISPDPSVARDYSNPVTFTVTEVYGVKVVYNVTVKGTACAVIKVPEIVPSTTSATASAGNII